jgi:uncharacterized damage-inducible protein DinB
VEFRRLECSELVQDGFVRFRWRGVDAIGVKDGANRRTDFDCSGRLTAAGFGMRIMKANGVIVPGTDHGSLLVALLDSWDRNNKILVNLLRVLPESGLQARVTEDSPSVTQLFTHMHFVRLVFLSEDAPEFARELPKEEWGDERDRGQIARMLNESAQAVRNAVESKVMAGQEMKLHYDHPILLLQHMVWHEGYHHGQIKLALKLTGHPIPDEEAGPVTWGIWMKKTRVAS